VKTAIFALGLALALGLGLLACELNQPECDAECQANWLDGEAINDYSSDLYRDSANFDSTVRLSTRIPTPDSATLRMPVILCVHGFSASTYEWKDFADYVGADNGSLVQAGLTDTVLVSRVLLGGHGGDLADFQKSTWRDWQKPILDEYDTLVARGYRDISLAGSSTACPLMLETFAQGFFNNKPAPREVFFIDPIIVASSKFLSLAPMIGPVIGNVESVGQTDEEKAHWYNNRPADQLEQLYTLINRVKNRLEDGQKLPKGVRLKVYKAKHDNAADPVSALYLKKGLTEADGSSVEVEMVDSRLHVFTRLGGRKNKTGTDSTLQRRVFDEMLQRLHSRSATQ
jgi:carboxylesterase